MKRSGVRLSVRLAVCLSHHSPTARRCGGFAAERRAGRRYRSRAAAAERSGCTAHRSKLRSAANASSVAFTADVGG